MLRSLSFLLLVCLASHVYCEGLDDFYKLGPDSLPQREVSGPHVDLKNSTSC